MLSSNYTSTLQCLNFDLFDGSWNDMFVNLLGYDKSEVCVSNKSGMAIGLLEDIVRSSSPSRATYSALVTVSPIAE